MILELYFCEIHLLIVFNQVSFQSHLQDPLYLKFNLLKEYDFNIYLSNQILQNLLVNPLLQNLIDIIFINYQFIQ